MSDKLKACPYCGGNNLATYIVTDGSCVVYCINCYENNDGLSHDIDEWNTRPIEDELQARITELEEALKSLRSDKHYVCDDCWYSCPKSGECCNDTKGDECDCGTDRRNAIIDKALEEK